MSDEKLGERVMTQAIMSPEGFCKATWGQMGLRCLVRVNDFRWLSQAEQWPGEPLWRRSQEMLEIWL